MLKIILERSKKHETTQFYFGKNKYVTIAYFPVFICTADNNSKSFDDVSCNLDKEKIKILIRLNKIYNCLRKFYEIEEYLILNNSKSGELYNFYEKMLLRCYLLKDKINLLKDKINE